MKFKSFLRTTLVFLFPFSLFHFLNIYLNCYFFCYLQQKIESATDVLKGILRPVVDEEEEISWPPRDPEALSLMEKVTLFS